VRVLYQGLNLGPQLDPAGEGRVIYQAVTVRSNLVEVPVALGGGGVPVTENRWLSRANSVDRQPFYSPDGARVIFTSNREGNMDLWEMTLASMSMRRLTDDPADDWDPYLSRDGQHLVWSSKRSGNYEIWIAKADGTGPRQLSHDGADAENPVMAPDGQGGEWVYYGSYGKEKAGVWRIRLDGSGATRVIAGTFRDPSPSPDGKYVALMDASDANHFSLRVARVSDGTLTVFRVDTSANAFTGGKGARLRWMPDGRSLVFGGSAVAEGGIYVQLFDPDRDTSATRKQIAILDSAVGIETFAVSPDGRRVVLSASEQPSDLVLVEGLAGLGPPRRRAAN
jgi:Tol biopolymer transport system component